MSDEYTVDEIRQSISDGEVTSLTAVLISDSVSLTLERDEHRVTCDVLDRDDELEVSDIRFNTNSSDGRRQIGIEELMDILDTAVEALNQQEYAVELSMPQRLSESVIVGGVTATEYVDDPQSVSSTNDSDSQSRDVDDPQSVGVADD